ncbi:MAG: IS1-like element transposase [Cyanobacteria bacterium P01_D01_bin.128]
MRAAVVKHGKIAKGKQPYRCRNDAYSRASFILNYSYRGYLPEVKAQIADIAVNGSGIRDTAQVLLGIRDWRDSNARPTA